MSRTKITLMIVSLALWGCVAQPSQNSGPKKPAVNLDAVLPPQSLLHDDTNTALTHDRGESRLAYVGVWATDGDKCAMMDQTAFEGFAVITPDSIRRSAETCTFEPGEPGSTSVRLDATCKARGNTSTQRTITLQMLSSRSLYLSATSATPAATMVRCRLLQ
ncbi:hypothetical protein WNZ14_17300 [Hoeflea sp. AS60]|uniref:hypothetical protein n=1 Tax=Hoeflea sp. AS60 TaxID=3135780 RepID=UPI0031794E30